MISNFEKRCKFTNGLIRSRVTRRQRKQIIKMDLDNSLFWDVEYENVNYEKYSQFIINRVLLRGNLKDWYEIKAYYGLGRIRQEITQMKYLDDKTLNFCSFYFNLPKTDFKCYNTPQSTKELWNY